MPYGYRLHNVALRGWLIATLVLPPYTLTAEQEIEEPPAALEQSQGTAIEAPAPQSKTSKPPAQQKPPAAQSSPAAPVQSERSAKPPCDARCQATEQREKDDLEAQRSMAEAAFDLVVISWWQLGAGTIGIALLMTTLWYTRKSTRAAINAAKTAKDVVEVARTNAVASRRAWLTLEDVKLMPQMEITEEGIGFVVQATINNLGQTPATNITVRFISHFPHSSGDQFKAAEAQFIKALRKSHISLEDAVLFPNDTYVHKLTWGVPKEKFEKDIRTHPESGERQIGITIFVGVGYRIVGDDAVHITYRSYVMLNIPVGFTVPDGTSVELQRMPFIAGKVD